LNLFDAPVLTTIELAFGHGCSVFRSVLRNAADSVKREGV
jgi:hypothetical protein